MICDVAIHSPGRGPDDNPNPHVHVLVPMRPLNENGTWGAKQRREYILDENGNRIRGEDGKYLFAYHHVFLAGLLLSTAVTL